MAVVALVAASVSYRHALEVVGQHGESGWLDAVYPLTVDGLSDASSMVLLNDARRVLRPHWLAYCPLWLGVSATLAVNVAAGLAYGTVGAIVAAWPAPALAISYELLILIVRRSARPVPEPPYLSPYPSHPPRSTPTGIKRPYCSPLTWPPEPCRVSGGRGRHPGGTLGLQVLLQLPADTPPATAGF